MKPPRTLSAAWEAEAQRWVAWARKPGHDSYWRFHRDQFFQLLPRPGRLTLDVGCGEGRVCRDLKEAGHTVIGIDVSPTIVAFAREADPQGEYHVASASNLPFADAFCDLVVAFMSLQDVDDLPAAALEIARVLEPGGHACLAIVHPINSAGKFTGEEADSPFVIPGSYLGTCHYADTFARDGLEMTFHSEHRPLETYSRALEASGLLVEAIREPAVPDHAAQSGRSKRWQRLPLFMHLRLVKPAS